MSISNEELKKEKERLNHTIGVIRGKISELEQELYSKEEKIQEFQKFIWDSRHDMDPGEMKSMIAVNDVEVNIAIPILELLHSMIMIQFKRFTLE